MRSQPLFQVAAWQPSSLEGVNSRKWRKSSRLSENKIVLTIVYQEAFLLFKSTLEQNLYFFIEVSLSMKSYGVTIYTRNC